MDINILIIILFILLFFLWPMFNMRVILFVLILILIFYKYLLCKSVNFLNTYLVVPPQNIINEIFIKPINYPFDLINDFVRSIKNVSIGFDLPISLGKVMGKRIGTTISWHVNPFNFLKDPLINTPIIRYLKVKCIPRPDMYEEFGFRDPSECYPKGYIKKKKDSNIKGELSSLLTTILIILVILLLFLLYIGNTKYREGEHVFQMLYDKINTMINLGKTTKVSEQIIQIDNKLLPGVLSGVLSGELSGGIPSGIPSELSGGIPGVLPNALPTEVTNVLPTEVTNILPSGIPK